MEIYGLYGFVHHGWTRVLTVMSPAGASATSARIATPHGLAARGGAGRLTRFTELRDGALDKLVERYGIVVLTKAQWDARKAELGDAVWR